MFEGLIDLEMNLSDEPPLGRWTIRTELYGQQKSRHFTVKEYGKIEIIFVISVMFYCFLMLFYDDHARL